MALKQHLIQKLEQRLSPQQIQLMKLLQVPTMELDQRIKQEIEENPALEEGADSEEDFEKEEDFDDDYEEDEPDFDISEYIETDAEELKEKLEAWKFENDDNEMRHTYLKDSEGFEVDDWNEIEAEKRMDIIGQNGNEGLHYRATDEDEAEFDDYGARIVTDSSFEWGDEPEDDNLFEGEECKSNQKLVQANERYKKEVKKMNTKQKRKNKD